MCLDPEAIQYASQGHHNESLGHQLNFMAYVSGSGGHPISILGPSFNFVAYCVWILRPSNMYPKATIMNPKAIN